MKLFRRLSGLLTIIATVVGLVAGIGGNLRYLGG
jgi:hypothetical protein